MEFRYTFSFTPDEIKGLTAQTKDELARKCADFAKVAGVATPDTASPVPQTVVVNGVPTVPAVRNQPNQANAVDPAIAGMPGAALPPGMPPGVPPAPVPSAMPIHTGAVPPAPSTAPPAPAPVAAMPQPVAPQPVPQPAPAQNQAPPVSAQAVQMKLIPRLMADVGSDMVMSILTDAGAQGILPSYNIQQLTDAAAPAFLQLVNQKTGQDFSPLVMG